MRKYNRPYRVKKKKSIFKNRFFWLTILFLIMAAEIFYLICFSSFFQIKEIKISGNEKVSTEDLEDLLNEKINQKILFSFSKSIFLANFSEIEKEILKHFPQVEQINLKRKFPNILFLQVKERKPAAIFCQDENCFFIDEHGVIFEFLDSNVTKKQDLLTLKKNMGREIDLGSSVIKEEQICKILEVESKLKNGLKILIEEILLISDERFDAKILEGWRIYFNFKEDLNWQLTKLGAVLEEEIPQQRRKNLEYIDVRFGNFAPYKYRD